MSLFGVGAVLGSQLIAEIGDVSRFSNKKALVGFAGIDAPAVPVRQFQSAVPLDLQARLRRSA